MLAYECLMCEVPNASCLWRRQRQKLPYVLGISPPSSTGDRCLAVLILYQVLLDLAYLEQLRLFVRIPTRAKQRSAAPYPVLYIQKTPLYTMLPDEVQRELPCNRARFLAKFIDLLHPDAVDNVVWKASGAAPTAARKATLILPVYGSFGGCPSESPMWTPGSLDASAANLGRILTQAAVRQGARLLLPPSASTIDVNDAGSVNSSSSTNNDDGMTTQLRTAGWLDERARQVLKAHIQDLNNEDLIRVAQCCEYVVRHITSNSCEWSQCPGFRPPIYGHRLEQVQGYGPYDKVFGGRQLAHLAFPKLLQRCCSNEIQQRSASGKIGGEHLEAVYIK